MMRLQELAVRNGGLPDAVASLVETAAAGRLIPFVGAGATCAATGAGYGWRDLLDRGHRYAGLDEAAKPADIAALAEVVHGTLKRSGRLAQWLRDEFALLEARSTDLLEAVTALSSQVMTTNYDSLLESQLRAPAFDQRDVGRALEAIRSGGSFVLHIHGVWSRPEGIVLDAASYSSVAGDEELRRAFLSSLATDLVVFIGCGGTLSDAHLLHRLDENRRSLSPALIPVALVTTAERAQLAGRMATGDLRVVVYGEGHDALPAFLRLLARAARALRRYRNEAPGAPADDRNLKTPRELSRLIRTEGLPDVGADLAPWLPLRRSTLLPLLFLADQLRSDPLRREPSPPPRRGLLVDPVHGIAAAASVTQTIATEESLVGLFSAATEAAQLQALNRLVEQLRRSDGPERKAPPVQLVLQAIDRRRLARLSPPLRAQVESTLIALLNLMAEDRRSNAFAAGFLSRLANAAPQRRANEVAAQIHDALAYFCFQSAQFARARRALDAAERHARRCTSFPLRSRVNMLLLRGEIHLQVNAYAPAAAAFRRGMALAVRIPDHRVAQRLQSRFVFNLASLAYRTWRVRTASAKFRDALEIALAAEDPAFAAIVANQLVNSLLRQGLVADAEAAIDDTRISTARLPSSDRGNRWKARAALWRVRSNPEAELGCLHRALESYDEAGSRYGKAHVLMWLGWLQVARGDGKGLELLRKAVDALKAFDLHGWSKALCLLTLAERDADGATAGMLRRLRPRLQRIDDAAMSYYAAQTLASVGGRAGDFRDAARWAAVCRRRGAWLPADGVPCL